MLGKASVSVLFVLRFAMFAGEEVNVVDERVGVGGGLRLLWTIEITFVS
jgi:hypothetical protein